MYKTNIPINIWDDFYEDDYVPKGKIQETYMYVEDSEFTHDECKDCLLQVFRFLETLDLPGVEMKMFFYDSRTIYPNLDEIYQIERWKITFKHLTHKRLDKLLIELQEKEFRYEKMAYEFYS